MLRRIAIKFTSIALLMGAMATVSAERAYADLHKDLARELILRCITGGCKSQPLPKKPQPYRPRMSEEQRQQNRNVQSALNAFNFNAGAVDGQLGRKSKAAISQYQAYMNFPVTGKLDDFQRQTLFDSWNKLQHGGTAAYPNMMSREGPRGLLRTALNPNYPAQFGDHTGMNPPIKNVEDVFPRNDSNPRGGHEINTADRGNDEGYVIP